MEALPQKKKKTQKEEKKSFSLGGGGGGRGSQKKSGKRSLLSLHGLAVAAALEALAAASRTLAAAIDAARLGVKTANDTIVAATPHATTRVRI